MLKSPACAPACLGPCPTSVPRGAAAHTVNTTPFLQGHFFLIHSSLGPRFPPFGLPGVSVVAPRCSELSFKDIFQSCSPEAPKEASSLPAWLLTGWRGRTWDRGLFFPLFQRNSLFGRGGVARTVFVVPWWEADMEKNPLGGSCGCFWSPQTSQEAVGAPTFCLESLLFPLSLFQSVETQVALPSSSGAGQMEKCRMRQSPSLFPAQGCTFPPALSPGLLSPASPPPSHQPWHDCLLYTI